MDILDLCPGEDETIDYQSVSDYAITWPDQGMSCPVIACSDKVYIKYLDLKAHWKLIHEPTVQLYCCGVCSFRHVRRSQVTRHMCRKHNSKDIATITLNRINAVNNKFVHPFNAKLPTIRPSVQSVLEREEHSRARALQAAPAKVLERSTIVSRDQCVVPGDLSASKSTFIYTKNSVREEYSAPSDLN